VAITYSKQYTKLEESEVKALYSFLKNTKGNVLELGRLWGGSTKIISSAINPRTLVSVDIKNRPLKAFKNTDTLDNIILITADSTVLSLEERFESIFIDVEPNIVHKNILNIWNNITTYFIFHDYPDIKDALDIFIKYKKLEIISLTNTLLITKKCITSTGTN
tara:strand:- start:2418 stop:2906 length:489 start_codon:yes stop_codon:yes gene_type:complete